jgi:hypothetical protein
MTKRILDSKIKDVDADVPLLRDRMNKTKIPFFMFFVVGWILSAGSILLPFDWDGLALGFGICFLIFATWFLLFLLYYGILIKIEIMKGENHGRDTATHK